VFLVKNPNYIDVFVKNITEKYADKNMKILVHRYCPRPVSRPVYSTCRLIEPGKSHYSLFSPSDDSNRVPCNRTLRYRRLNDALANCASSCYFSHFLVRDQLVDALIDDSSRNF
jgi:hypothetical protein